MTDREKLEDLIYRAHHNASCVIGHAGSEDEAIEEEVRYLIANGVTVMQMQKPLTVAKAMSFRRMWLEFRKGSLLTGLTDVILYEWGDDCLRFVPAYETRLSCGELVRSISCDILKYGTGWRCWAEKPTEVERKAAEWET